MPADPSPELVDCILRLRELLHREYAGDFDYEVLVGGRVLAASNLLYGSVAPGKAVGLPPRPGATFDGARAKQRGVGRGDI